MNEWNDTNLLASYDDEWIRNSTKNGISTVRKKSQALPFQMLKYEQKWESLGGIKERRKI
jgi:hypothetical protein